MNSNVEVFFRLVADKDPCRAKFAALRTRSRIIGTQMQFHRRCEGKGCGQCKFAAELLRDNPKHKATALQQAGPLQLHSWVFAVNEQHGVVVYVDQLYNRGDDWLCISLEMQQSAQLAFNRLYEQLNKPFNFTGYYCLALPYLSYGCSRGSIAQLEAARTWFCSELFSAVLACVGEIEQCVPKRMTPALLYAALLNKQRRLL